MKIEQEELNLLHSIGKDEINRIFSYKYCELDTTFLGFINNYKDLKDFTIIDIGCYQAVQGNYFKDHASYIGVEPAVPIEYRLHQKNASYYHQTAQSFINDTLVELIKNGLDLEKTFAICSAVPDKEARKMVMDMFPYYRIAYPGQKTVEVYPKEQEKELESCR